MFVPVWAILAIATLAVVLLVKAGLVLDGLASQRDGLLAECERLAVCRDAAEDEISRLSARRDSAVRSAGEWRANAQLAMGEVHRLTAWVEANCLVRRPRSGRFSRIDWMDVQARACYLKDGGWWPVQEDGRTVYKSDDSLPL